MNDILVPQPNVKQIKIRFTVDETTYETPVNLDWRTWESGSVMDITELQSDIRKGVKSGGKEKRIIVL